MMRIDDDGSLDLEEVDAVLGTLSDHEVAWRDRQIFLQSRGYMLRPRLRPGWHPSWISPRKDFTECEDSILLPVCFWNALDVADHAHLQQGRVHLVDATRISDGTPVYIKRVKTGDNESSIAVHLDQESLRQNPRNHSIPVFDLFGDSEDPTISYMVMPFLSTADVPPFETVGEVVDFCEQLLEVCTCCLFNLRIRS